MNVPKKGNKSGDVLRQTYFLGTRTQNQKIGQRNKAGLWLKKLKCEICQRTFHYEFGLQSHSAEVHGVDLATARTTSKKTNVIQRKDTKRRKRKKSSSDEDIRISDSEEEQDDPESSGSFETVERRIVYSPKKKVQSEEPKPKTFYMGIQEAEILGTNEAFQPQLKLEDIYKNPERYTSMQLPPLPNSTKTCEIIPSDDSSSSSSSSSDSEDEIRTDEEISKTEFVNKVRRRSESSKSSPDLIILEQEAAGSPKPKSVVKKERIERIFKQEPMTNDYEVIELD